MKFSFLIALVPFVGVLASPPPPPLQQQHQQEQQPNDPQILFGANQQQQYNQQPPPPVQQQYQHAPPPVSYQQQQHQQQQYTQAPIYNQYGQPQQQQQQYQQQPPPPPPQHYQQQAPPPPPQQPQHHQQQQYQQQPPYNFKKHFDDTPYFGGDPDNATTSTKRKHSTPQYKGQPSPSHSSSPIPLHLRPLNLPQVNPLDQLHFRLQQGKQICLTEELPKATVLLVKYSASAWNMDTLTLANSNFDIQVTIKDPMGNVVSRQQSRPTDRLFLTAATTGIHQICFQTSGIYNSKIIVKLGVEVFIGGAGDPHIISPVEAQLHDLASVIRTAVGQVSILQKEQSLQKSREDSYKILSNSIDSMIIKWGIIQAIMAIISSYYQVFHMRGFFRYKKLV